MLTIHQEVNMTKKYRKFTATEKSKIALEAIKGELTIAQISSKYTVHATQVNKWKKVALAQLPAAFSGKQKQIEQDYRTYALTAHP